MNQIRKGQNNMSMDELMKAIDNDSVEVLTPICIVCNEKSVMRVRKSDLAKYQHGALVQVAFPEMPAAQREQFVSGTHSECWDVLMSSSDDNYENEME